MVLITLTKEDFQAYSDQVSSSSFMQSIHMGDLLEKRVKARKTPVTGTRSAYEEV